MKLAPFRLSAFQHIYRVSAVAEGKRIALWLSVRNEILLWGRTSFGIEAPTLGLDILDKYIDMGDSADRRCAMMTRESSLRVIQQRVESVRDGDTSLCRNA